YSRLPDPVLLFSGSPYITLEAINPLFGTEARWDKATQSLLFPTRYGRLRDVAVPVEHQLRWLGYRPKPFAFGIEEFVAYYQRPEPVYPADHQQIYESVRDPLTNNVIPSPDSGLETLSGRILMNASGNTGGIPFDGRGTAEKIGSHSHVVNGSASWGFPVF